MLLAVTLVGSSVAGIAIANDGSDFATTSADSGDFYFPASQSNPGCSERRQHAARVCERRYRRDQSGQ